MNAIYRALNTTKQNVHQRLNRYLAEEEEGAQLLTLMDEVREDHPRMGGKSMYVMFLPRTIGRDKFLRIYQENGLKLHQMKAFRRTTVSSGVIRFPNLIQGFELNGINQVWVSDITYFELPDRYAYLTFIMDLFSRKIIGNCASQTLRTEYTTIPALEMALKRIADGDTKPIIHSDGGGQYYSKSFLKLTTGKLINSMGESVYENSHAERINGTIKNMYLIPWNPTNFEQLKKYLTRAVNNYNSTKPHQALCYLTPDQFEQRQDRYPHKNQLLTKEKRSKKEKLYNSNNYV